MMNYIFAICFLFVSGTSFSANPSSPAVPGKARIVITSEPLGGLGVTADVAINGQKVASVGVDEPYSGVFAPGRMVVAVSGGKAEFNAEADKEYLLEVALVLSREGFFAFGLIGSLAMGSFKITLKETREILATTARGVITEQPSVPTQRLPEQIKQSPQVQPVQLRAEGVPEKVANSPSSVVGANNDIQSAQRLVVAEPSNARAWRELASQYQSVGETDKAIRAYQESLRLEPNDVLTLEALGILYAKGGQKDKVREVWEGLGKIDKARADKFFSAYILP